MIPMRNIVTSLADICYHIDITLIDKEILYEPMDSTANG